MFIKKLICKIRGHEWYFTHKPIYVRHCRRCAKMQRVVFAPNISGYSMPVWYDIGERCFEEKDYSHVL